MDCFDVFYYSFSYCYSLVVHLHHNHLVTTFELSNILTNILNNIYFLSEINIFNKLTFRMA